MATIRADTRKTREISSDFLLISKNVERDASALSSAAAKLDKSVKARNSIGPELDDMYKILMNIVKSLQDAGILTTESSVALASAEAKNVADAAAMGAVAGTVAAGVKNAASPVGAGAKSPTSAADVPDSPNSTERRNAAASKFKESAKEDQKEDPIPGKPSRITGMNTAEITNPTVSTGNRGAAKPKTDIKIGSHRETAAKPRSDIQIGAHRETAVNTGTPAKPVGTFDKVGQKLTALSDKAVQYVKDNKDAYIGKAAQVGVGLGVTAVGAGLGSGVKYAANKLGIPSASAAEGADFTLTGLGGTNVNVDGNTVTSTTAALGEIKAGAGYKAEFDPAKGNIGVNANAGFSVTGAKAGASYHTDNVDLSAEAMVGAVSGHASADASLMRDGKVTPKVIASVGVEAASAKGVASAAVNKDGYSAAAKAVGKVASAEAGAYLAFDPASGRAMASAGAMAAAAKGEISGSADLGPVKVSGKLTGYTGAAGAEVSAGFEDGQLKFKAGAALGVGAGFEVGIGVGNWAEKLDKVTGGAVGDAVSAVGSAANAALAPVGAIISTAKNAVDSFSDIGKGIVSGDAKAIVAGVGKLVTGTGKAIYEGAKTVVTSVGDAIVSGGKAVVNVAKTIGTGIANGFKTIFSGW
ncbi:MAG: hypothetical protein LBS84_02105 [Clostridiales bacterium]|jgi:hypothetical protein|nr:hypothetical protein [Clostridiales bacterium]